MHMQSVGRRGMVGSDFCTTLPTQLKAWSASSLRGYLRCPRYHQLSRIEGWQSSNGSIDRDFGSLYHTGCEMFDKALLAGETKERAILDTLLYFANFGQLLETSYLPCWTCQSPATVIGPRSKKAQRNAKRCSRAKSPQFDSGHHGGEPCFECGSDTVDDWGMISVSKQKNRNTLLRSLLYYMDTSDDRVAPYIFPDGTTAVELDFTIPLPLVNPDGEPYLLTGKMDGMVQFAGEVVPRERKTTKSVPNAHFFQQYEPDVQIDTYDLVCYLLFSPLLDPKPHGVMVEVTQVTEHETTIERQIINISEERRAEWLLDLQYWIKQAEECARSGYYPKNTASCGMYGGCEFRSICKMAPSSRSLFLPGERFEKRLMREMTE